MVGIFHWHVSFRGGGIFFKHLGFRFCNISGQKLRICIWIQPLKMTICHDGFPIPGIFSKFRFQLFIIFHIFEGFHLPFAGIVGNDFHVGRWRLPVSSPRFLAVDFQFSTSHCSPVALKQVQLPWNKFNHTYKLWKPPLTSCFWAIFLGMYLQVPRLYGGNGMVKNTKNTLRFGGGWPENICTSFVASWYTMYS